MNKNHAIRQYPDLREGATVQDQDGDVIGRVKSLRENGFELRTDGPGVDTTVSYDDILIFEGGHLVVKKTRTSGGTPDNLRGPKDHVGVSAPDSDPLSEPP